MVMNYGWPPLGKLQGGSKWTEIWGPVLRSLHITHVVLSQLNILTYNPVRVLSPESVPDLGVVHHVTTVSVDHSRGGPRLAVVSEPQIYGGDSVRFYLVSKDGERGRVWAG